jgi:uncharacterized protein YjiS (DUF1127 family)
MLRKHARDRITLTNLIREKSMPLAKPLPRTESPSVISLPRRLDRPAPSRHSAQELRASSPPDSVRPPKIVAVASTTSQVMLETSVGLAQSAGIGFVHTILAILSFLVAEVLAGFAAYALAMHPTAQTMDEAEPPARSQSRLPIPLASRMREAHARRRAVAELHYFDDRSLRDIGISRSEIKVIALHGRDRE